MQPETDLDIIRYQVEQFVVSDDGNYVVEKSPEFFILIFEDVEIDLNSDYNITENTISQGEKQIQFLSPEDTQYFLNLIEDLI